MFSFLSVISGVLIAVMIVCNGDLSSVYGNYQATVVIHATGLVCILLWMLFRREKFSLSRGMPFLYYLGGVFGVCTT
ncbi:MAG: EamA-like transporter family protein, partial [Clostridia bacterium]|nr:EamA-like transporter family protein [Clostridia bacterium]